MLYMDTEFNGFNGQLISMGIVSSRTHKEFYGVLKLPKNVHPWVAEHVVPYLMLDAEDYGVFRHRLYLFLKEHEGETIVADWPEDLSHLLQCLCDPGGNGVSYDLELDLRLIKSKDIKPFLPHNALSDAKALMDWHINEMTTTVNNSINGVLNDI